MGTTPETAEAVTPNLTTATLTLSPRDRDKILTRIGESDRAMLDSTLVFFPYTRWTADEVINALYRSADAEGMPLTLTDSSKTKLRRRHAVAKAWIDAKADDLVGRDEGDDTRDAVLTDLAKIANYEPSALELYLIPEEDRGESEDESQIKYEDVMVAPLSDKAKVQFPAFVAEISYGCGRAAMLTIVKEFVNYRVRTSPDMAAEWISKYRRGVEFASNEKRRKAQAHNSVAAESRVGTGTGTTGEAAKGGAKTKEQQERGARNQGGTGGAAAQQAAAANAQQSAPVEHKTPGDKTLREATFADLVRTLNLLVVDVTRPMSPEESKMLDDLFKRYDERMEALPLGTTMSKAPATADAMQKAAQDAINAAPAAPGSVDALLRAIAVELAAKGLTAESLLAASAG